MARPHKERLVEKMPPVTYYKPVSRVECNLEEMILTVEEMEALRLSDIEKLDQIAASEKMEVSSPTFNRIINTAHQKIALALWEGRAIRVSGGNFSLSRCRNCCRRRGCVDKNNYCKMEED